MKCRYLRGILIFFDSEKGASLISNNGYRHVFFNCTLFHSGKNKNCNTFRRLYRWPNLRKQCASYVYHEKCKKGALLSCAKYHFLSISCFFFWKRSSVFCWNLLKKNIRCIHFSECDERSNLFFFKKWAFEVCFFILINLLRNNSISA